jgi:hypothetical protein
VPGVADPRRRFKEDDVHKGRDTEEREDRMMRELANEKREGRTEEQAEAEADEKSGD